MKRNKHSLSALLALVCVLTVLLSLLPTAAFADDPAPAEEEEAVEEGPSTDGQLIIGNADGSAGENEGKIISISSAEEFRDFSLNCRSSAWSIGLSVNLTGDIDFGGRAIMPVPSFSGTFFGNGHTIKNFSCGSNGSHQGLFRYLEEGGRIVDLQVSGSITPDGSQSSVGGIVGTSRGTVTGCSFSGTVTGLISVGGIVGENLGVITRCESAGSISGKHFAGGIAGYSEGTIRACTNRAEVNIEVRDEAIDIESLDIHDIIGINLVSAEDKDTVSDIGGIVGISLGLVDACTNEGTVGYQHYGYNVGGIAGRQSGYLSQCVNNGTVFGRKDVGGIVGQMEPYLILDDSASLVDEIEALQSAMNAAMGNMSAASESLGSSARQVSDSGTNIASHYTAKAIDNGSGAAEAREKQEHREDFNDAASGAGSAVGDAAGSLGDDTISDIANGNVTDADQEALINAGSGLAVDGGADLIHRLDLLNEQREAELAALEAENARMRAEFASLSAGLNNMGRTIHNTLSGLAGDMKSVNAHTSNILTMFTNALSGNMQLRVMEDISDLDTDEDMNGKVLSCANNGAVNGDTNIGGITGSMGVEAEFDMEGILSASITDTVQISTDSYFARCVVRKCVNNGAVTAKKDYNGGICGLAELGVISSSENYGDVIAGGEYVGGIVGRSKSIVADSYAMCALDGSEYVGGISGQGKRVVSCSSIVEMDESIACSGAICGWADGEDEDLFIYHNSFVSDTLGGVDGISYDEAAEPVSYRELYAMENLPERFRSLRVTFRAEGLIVAELSVPYGGSVAPEDIPPVPEISGYSGLWPDIELENLTASTVVDAIYLDRLTGLSADYVREGSPLSVVIIEGLFEPGSSISVSDWSDAIVPAQHYRLCEALRVDIASRAADLESHSVHYLLPERAWHEGEPVLCVHGENGLEMHDYQIDGSYLVFDASGSEVCFCVLVGNWDPAVLLSGALLLVILLALLVLLLLRLRKKRRAAKAAAEVDAEGLESADEAAQDGSVPTEGYELPTETPIADAEGAVAEENAISGSEAEAETEDLDVEPAEAEASPTEAGSLESEADAEENAVTV